MAKSTKKLTAERLREVLDYDPETGAFTWRKPTSNRVRAGSKAGCEFGKLGVLIRLDGELHRAARLAWLHVTGEWPEHPVHFRNECVSDLRWSNLYELPLGGALKPWPNKKSSAELTADRLRELLDYDPETGIFRRKVALSGRAEIGSPVGTANERGYIKICVDGRSYRAHRLAWLYVYGGWPAGQIDHKDMDRGNNRIGNLRLATNALNHANRGPQKNNTSGYKGVYWIAREKKLLAKIVKDGRQVHLGLFDAPEDASRAYEIATRRLNGEFGRAT